MGKIEEAKDHILHLFLNRYWSANMIATDLGVSRQGVILALQSWGIDTSKSSAGFVEVTCGYKSCGRVFKTYRNIARKKLEEGKESFCGHDCWQKWMREQLS